ncbi:MAG: LL-diaminopimelate aminotransferase [Firmicutes bacterium]|nr:LL-diaminopimelate aminotransferase [Bacillota bacterium]
MRKARRIERVPPYLFAEIDRKRREAEARGVDIISLGIGDPDVPTPDFVVDRLAREARDPATHCYPPYQGTSAFRQAVAGYYRSRFGVELDPEREVLALIGSKEGLAHLVWAFVDPGDAALVSDPGYPVYGIHTLLAGGEVIPVPLLPERGFLPDLEALAPEGLRRAKLLFLCYPNNPTAGTADLEFFRRAVAFAREHDLLLVHDSAYVEITFDGYEAPSVLQVEGAKEVAVEFGSLSKPFNMTGWRLGYVVGSREAVAALSIIKTNTDSGQFTAVQRAGVEALTNPASREFILKMRDIYQRRRDAAVRTLRRLGCPVEPPRGSFYLWAPVPQGFTSAGFAEHVLERAGVIVTPGSAYGARGEGYFRVSLTLPDERLEEALVRLESCVSW